MNGYDENFLGVALPLPSFTPARIANLVPPSAQLPDGVAAYPNYAVVTDKKLRAPAFAVLHIEQSKLKTTKRSSSWKIDSRVGTEAQLDNSYYADTDAGPNHWDRGHMADRQSAAWGDTLASAQDCADETFYYSNACLQHKHLNEDEWLALETWVMKLDVVQNDRLTVFTGPISGPHPRIVTPPGRSAATVPVGFFKVACFVNSGTGQLDVRAFIIYQDADTMQGFAGRKTFNYTKYQVTITEIERLTDLRFPDAVRANNPLYYHPNPAASRRGATSFPERIDINQSEDLIHRHVDPRTPVMDDKLEVYIAAALVSPAGGPRGEWVSLANFENKPINITGWKLVDSAGNKLTLSGSIPDGGTVVLRGAKLRPIRLPDTGGVLTLLNAKGQRIDREDYSKAEVAALRRAAGKNQPLNFLTYRQGLGPN